MSDIKNPCIECKYSVISSRYSSFHFLSNKIVFCCYCGARFNDDLSCEDFEKDYDDTIKLKRYLLSL